MEETNTATLGVGLFDGAAWFDRIEAGVRERMRGFIETMLEEELTAALGRSLLRENQVEKVPSGRSYAVSNL